MVKTTTPENPFGIFVPWLTVQAHPALHSLGNAPRYPILNH